MEDKLQHHGILGMRWGVRRSKAQLRRARGPDAPRRVTKEQYEAEKKKAIQSGDKATVERWKTHLSKTELRAALDAIDMHRTLKDVDKETVKSGWEKTKSAIESITTVATFAGTLKTGYDSVRSINNTFNPRHKLPKLER